jgi:hypothetical protein
MLVYLLAAVDTSDGHLHVAPLGTPYDLNSPQWIDAGPAPERLDALTQEIHPPPQWPGDGMEDL